MKHKKPWECSTCGRRNPPVNLCCGQCGGDRDSGDADEPEGTDYATKADLDRVEKKIDALGGAKPAAAPAATSKKKRKELDLLEDEPEDEDEGDGEDGDDE